MVEGFFVKDTKERSSGTFSGLASPSPNPGRFNDGDILQLGADYQGGAEDIYKSVKIKIELSRE